MTERLFNLFVFIDDGIIREFGATTHDREGTDQEKLKFLQAQVPTDFSAARRFPVAPRYILVKPGAADDAGLQYKAFQTLTQSGRHLEVFEEVFAALEGPDNPLFCITPDVNGEPKADDIARL